MKKVLLVLWLLTFNLVAQQQNTEAKQDNSATCNFKLDADTILIGKTLRLASFTFTGEGERLKKRTANKIRRKAHFMMFQKITITRQFFSNVLKDVCVIKNFKLTTLKITSTRDGYITLGMIYKK